MLEGEVGRGGERVGTIGDGGQFLDPPAGPPDERLRAHDGDVFAAQRGQDDREQAHVVEHRQPRDTARVVVELDRIDHLQCIGGHRLIGDDHAGRHPGGTRGVLQICRIVQGRFRLDPCVADRIGNGIDGDDTGAFLGRQRLEEVTDGLGRFGRCEDHTRLAVGEHRGEPVGVTRLVRREQRNRDVAREQRPEEADHVLQRLRGQDGHPVARLRDLLQPRGDGTKPLAELGPGQVDRLAIAFAAVVHEAVRERLGLLDDIAFHVVDQRHVVVEEQISVLVQELVKLVVHSYS